MLTDASEVQNYASWKFTDTMQQAKRMLLNKPTFSHLEDTDNCITTMGKKNTNLILFFMVHLVT